MSSFAAVDTWNKKRTNEQPAVDGHGTSTRSVVSWLEDVSLHAEIKKCIEVQRAYNKQYWKLGSPSYCDKA